MHNFDFKKGVWGRKYESSCFTTSTAAGNTFFQIWNKRLLQDGYEMKGDEEIIMITTLLAAACTTIWMNGYPTNDLILPTITEVVVDEDEYIEYVLPLASGEEEQECLEDIEESEIVCIEEEYEEEITVMEND
jgi:hypothetical protein